MGTSENCDKIVLTITLAIALAGYSFYWIQHIISPILNDYHVSTFKITGKGIAKLMLHCQQKIYLANAQLRMGQILINLYFATPKII